MNIKRFIGLTLGIAAVAVVGANKANAQRFTPALLDAYSCTDANYGTLGTYVGESTSVTSIYSTSLRQTYTANCEDSHTSNAPSSVVTAVDTLRSATAQTAGLISNRISFVRNQASAKVPYSVSLDENGNAHLGFAGGSKDRGMGIWVQGSISNIDNDSSSTQYEGDISTAMIGVDKTFKGKYLIGLSVGFEKTDITTSFNSGNLESNAFTIAPYASLTLSKGFSVDASFGYSDVEYDQNRLDSQTRVIITANNIDAERYFGTLNINASKKIKKLNIGATLGAVYSVETKDAFTETGTAGLTPTNDQATHVGQGRFGVNAGVHLGALNPYAKVTGVLDFSKTDVSLVGASQTTPDDTDFGADFAVGVNLSAKGVTATVEGYTTQFRDNWSEYGGTARLRIEF